MNVLIAGGTGLIGTQLCKKLTQKGHRVSLLSRSPHKTEHPIFLWDPEKGAFDRRALANMQAVVNLAGIGVNDKRWTPAYKKKILESRISGTRLLLGEIGAGPSTIQTYISASGISYYGHDSGSQLVDENTPKGTGFLADVAFEWEKEALKAEKIGLRAVCVRTGVVLSAAGGALPQLALPVRWWIGSPLASGRQCISWIDIDDLVDLYVFLIENGSLRGIFNGVAPHPISNEDFIQQLASYLHKPLWAPHVPAWLLSLAVGEMAEILIGGNCVSSRKIASHGFVFSYPTLLDSLRNQLRKRE